MKMLTILFFLASYPVWSLDITCDVNHCNYSNNTKVLNTSFGSGGIFQDLTSDDGVNISIENETLQSKTNLDTSFSVNINQSFVNSNETKTHSFISPYPSSISVTSNAVNGTNGKNTSKICAENFRNGNYGASAKTFFESRHGASDNCDSIDLDYLKNNGFDCDPGYILSGTSNVPIEILKEKRLCKSNIVNNLCVKKSYDINCTNYAKGPYCCNDSVTTRQFSSYTDHIFPISYFNSLGSCNPSLCNLTRNGVFISGSVRVFGESAKSNPVNCESKQTLSLTFSDLTTNKTINTFSSSATRNNVDISTGVIVKNSSNVTLTGVNYRLIPVNINEIKSSSLEFKNCLGLNSTAENDYTCDFKPGPDVTVKFIAIDSSGNYSNEVNLVIGRNRYIKSKTTKIYNYRMLNANGSYLYITQTDVQNTFDDNSTQTISGKTTFSTSGTGTTINPVSTYLNWAYEASGLGALITTPGSGAPYRYSGGRFVDPGNNTSIPKSNEISIFPTFYLYENYNCFYGGCWAEGFRTSHTYSPSSTSTINGTYYADYNGNWP